MSAQPYRRAFLVAVPILLAVAVAFAALWWRARQSVADAARYAAAPVPTASMAVPPPAGPPADEPLPTMQVSPERLQRIGVTFGEVRSQSLHSTIRTVGDVTIDERRVCYVQSRYSGWVRDVAVDTTFEHVQTGQVLLTIDSPDVTATEEEYLLALRQQGTLGRSEIPGVAAGAASLLSAAEARLEQWHVPDREIDRLRTSGMASRALPVESPATGYVIERRAIPNQHVDPDTRLYTIADLSTVWVTAALVQSDLSQVQTGSDVTVTSDALPGRTLSGRVDVIYPEVDPTTRTARARIICRNPGLELKPGMSMNLALDVALGQHLVVPASAVFQSGARSVVFIDHGGGSLQPRVVEAGALVGDDRIVRRGLTVGERIVTSAGFLLDSESQLQAALGSFAPPPPGAGTAAALSPAPKTPPLTIDFTTEPSPARSGTNVFEVHLTDEHGAPVSGAQVTVQLFMPAMPQMGMAALSASVSLPDRGSGVYSGPAALQNAGTWRVTITVASHGATVATKQLSLTVAAGTTR